MTSLRNGFEPSKREFQVGKFQICVNFRKIMTSNLTSKIPVIQVGFGVLLTFSKITFRKIFDFEKMCTSFS